MIDSEAAHASPDDHDAWFRVQVERALERHRSGNAKVLSLEEVRESIRARIREKQELAAASGPSD